MFIGLTAFTGGPMQFCYGYRYVIGILALRLDPFPGDYSVGAPPLPIPNRVVKPHSADGTAPPGGRVGRCQVLS